MSFVVDAVLHVGRRLGSKWIASHCLMFCLELSIIICHSCDRFQRLNETKTASRDPEWFDVRRLQSWPVWTCRRSDACAVPANHVSAWGIVHLIEPDNFFFENFIGHIKFNCVRICLTQRKFKTHSLKLKDRIVDHDFATAFCWLANWAWTFVWMTSMTALKR